MDNEFKDLKLINQILLNEIRSLHRKLSEYEIIDNDIADLAKFKKQASKLEKQLEDIQNRKVLSTKEVDDLLLAVEEGEVKNG